MTNLRGFVDAAKTVCTVCPCNRIRVLLDVTEIVFLK